MAESLKLVDRKPMTFENARLIATDFDGTVAQTFDKSPRGIGVIEAYETAIETHAELGLSALSLFHAQGGLKNRAPLELVRDLTDGMSPEDRDNVTSELVRIKLAVLLGEIGTKFIDGSSWPRPMPGYITFKSALEKKRHERKLFDDLILSSGHQQFITATFDSWGIQPPTHIVAEETLRSIPGDYAVNDLVKPSPLLMGVARALWRSGYGIDPHLEEPNELTRIVYIGDDLKYDGGLARNSGVAFVHVTKDNSEQQWSMLGRSLQLDRAKWVQA